MIGNYFFNFKVVQQCQIVWLHAFFKLLFRISRRSVVFNFFFVKRYHLKLFSKHALTFVSTISRIISKLWGIDQIVHPARSLWALSISLLSTSRWHKKNRNHTINKRQSSIRYTYWAAIQCWREKKTRGKMNSDTITQYNRESVQTIYNTCTTAII